MGLGAFTYWNEDYWLHWAFAVKFNPDGSVTRLKALLVAKVMIRLIELVILILFLL